MIRNRCQFVSHFKVYVSHILSVSRIVCHISVSFIQLRRFLSVQRLQVTAIFELIIHVSMQRSDSKPKAEIILLKSSSPSKPSQQILNDAKYIPFDLQYKQPKKKELPKITKFFSPNTSTALKPMNASKPSSRKQTQKQISEHEDQKQQKLNFQPISKRKGVENKENLPAANYFAQFLESSKRRKTINNN